MISDEKIIRDLLKNHADKVDVAEYTQQKNLANRYGVSEATVSRKIRKLVDKGLLKLHTGKSAITRGMLGGNPNIYIPTLIAIENGGLVTNFHQITGSPLDSVIRTFGIGLADMHGKLHIRIPIKEAPEKDGLTWKGPVELNNGIKQYIRHIFHAGDRVSIEKFVGGKNPSIILKPHFLSQRGDTPEALINHFVEVAWAIWVDLEMAGYRLEFPEGPKGEAKFTLRCKAFEEIGYTESENILIDYSKGKAELHPTTGTLHGNRIMSDLLLSSPTIKAHIETDILSDEQKVRALDEIGELSKMVTAVNDTRNRVEQAETKIGVIAQSVSSLAKDINKFMGMLEGTQKEQPDKPHTDPGGMFG